MVWLACSDTAPSASLEEAQKIHAQLDRLSADVHGELQMALDATEARIESSMAIGDSLLAMQLARVESQLGELDVRFHDWEATVAPLPGAACDHDHAGHDHDHAHDHDHGSSASMEGMSDEAILEIQQALMIELLAMKDALTRATSSLEANENASDEE